MLRRTLRLRRRVVPRGFAQTAVLTAAVVLANQSPYARGGAIPLEHSFTYATANAWVDARGRDMPEPFDIKDTREISGRPDVVFPFEESFGSSESSGGVDANSLTYLTSSLVTGSSGELSFWQGSGSFYAEVQESSPLATDSNAISSGTASLMLEVVDVPTKLTITSNITQSGGIEGSNARTFVRIAVNPGTVTDINGGFAGEGFLYNYETREDESFTESFVLPPGKDYLIYYSGYARDTLDSGIASNSSEFEIEMTFADLVPETYRWNPVDALNLWSVSENWNPDGEPSEIDSIVFDRPGAHFFVVDGDPVVEAIEATGATTNVFWSGDDEVSRSLSANSFKLGTSTLDNPTVTVSQLDVNLNEVQIGAVRGAPAKLIVDDGATVAVANAFFVGPQERGELEIYAGGTVTSSELYVAEEFGNGSSVKVDGGALQVHNLILGNGRPASLQALNSADVHADGIVNVDAGSDAVVSGVETTWTSGATSIRHGTLEFSDLAVGQISNVLIGATEDDASLAKVVVANNAGLDVQTLLRVGDATAGRGGLMEIDNGQVSAAIVAVAGGTASSSEEMAAHGARLEVRGPLAILAAAGEVSVGEGPSSRGILSVSDGASVAVTGASTDVASAGFLSISGAGTHWTQEFGDLEVSGVLSVRDQAEAKFDSVVLREADPVTGGGLATVANAMLVADDRIEISGIMLLTDGQMAAPTEVLVKSTGKLLGTGEVDTPRLHAESGGYIAPGLSPGQLSVTGDVEIDPGGVLEIEVAGLSAGDQYDVLSVGGDLTVEGEVLLSFIDGYAPRQGDVVEFFAVEGVTNLETASFAILNLAKGFEYELAPSAAGYQLTALNDAQFRFAADFNFDDAVDLTDFNVLKSNFGLADATQDEGDANDDGTVDLIDFTLLKGQFGASVAVPEPSSLGIAAICALTLAARSLRREN